LDREWRRKDFLTDELSLGSGDTKWSNRKTTIYNTR
jgi:hypothetical protein